LTKINGLATGSGIGSGSGVVEVFGEKEEYEENACYSCCGNPIELKCNMKDVLHVVSHPGKFDGKSWSCCNKPFKSVCSVKIKDKIVDMET